MSVEIAALDIKTWKPEFVRALALAIEQGVADVTESADNSGFLKNDEA